MSKKGKTAFIEYYTDLLGTVGFDAFRAALEQKTSPILAFSPKNEDYLKNLWKQHSLPWKTSSVYANALLWPERIEFGTTLPGYEDHLFYPMNPSSLLPPLALEAKPGERVLDACAAPGGKTLIIANAMAGEGELIANDMSRARSARLLQTMHFYDQPWVQVTTSDAATLFRREEKPFDRVLLDAPCSSEKHVWNSKKHLAQWSPGRVKQLSQRQFALLSGLWRVLKPGGRMVYSTCAVTPEENELLIEKFLQRYGNDMHLVSTQRVNPDETFDPMFIAVLERT